MKWKRKNAIAVCFAVACMAQKLNCNDTWNLDTPTSNLDGCHLGFNVRVTGPLNIDAILDSDASDLYRALSPKLREEVCALLNWERRFLLEKCMLQ
jgi:hypothetical protein